jgi:hypothetical protein
MKSLMKTGLTQGRTQDPDTAIKGAQGSLCAYQNCNNISQVWTTV